MNRLPRGLLIAVLVGMMSGLILGGFTYSQTNNDQLVFIEGPSISILTEKTDFKLGEIITIKIVNSGTIPLVFPDASYGLKVTGLDSVMYYMPMAAQVITTLEPKEGITFIWNQKRMDGSDSSGGIYKIVVEGFDPENNKVKKSIAINVLK